MTVEDDRLLEVIRATSDMTAEQAQDYVQNLGLPKDLVERISTLKSREIPPRPDRPSSLQTQTDDMAGWTVAGYKLERQIGAGGTGRVYVGRQQSLDFTVAVKLLNKQHAGIAENAQRLLREAGFLRRVSHAFLPCLIDGGIAPEGVPFIVTEYVDGQHLNDYCRQWRLSVEHRLVLFLRICDVVGFCHNNDILHLDLKPRNILVGNDGYPRVIDFGISDVRHPALRSIGDSENRLGGVSPGYASPQRLRNERPEVTDDVFSLGVILYELLTGILPADDGKWIPLQQAVRQPGTNPVDANEPESETSRELIAAQRDTTPGGLLDALPPELDEICHRMLSWDAVDRYPRVSLIQDELLRCLSGSFQSESPRLIQDDKMRQTQLLLERREREAGVNEARSYWKAFEASKSPVERFLFAARATDLADVPENRGMLLHAAGQCAPPAGRYPAAHSDLVTRLAFSPNGQILASASLDGSVALFDTQSDNLIRTFIAHMGPVRDVSFSPDGRRLASCGADGVVRVWQLDSGSLLARFDEHVDRFALKVRVVWNRQRKIEQQNWPGAVEQVRFDPERELLYAAGSDGILRVWDLNTNECVMRLFVHDCEIFHIDVVSAAGKVVVFCRDGSVFVCDVQGNGRVVSFVLIPGLDDHLSFIGAVVLSADRAIIANGQDTITIDLESGKTTARLPVQSGFFCPVAYSPTANCIFVAASDRSVRVIDLLAHCEVNRLEIRFWLSSSNGPTAISSDSAGKTVAIGTESGGIAWWRRAPIVSETKLFRHTNRVRTRSVHLSPSGDQFAVCGEDLLLGPTFCGSTGLASAVIPMATQGRSQAIGFDSNEQSLWQLEITGNLNRFATANGQLLASVRGHNSLTADACISTDGSWQMSVDLLGAITAWDSHGAALFSVSPEYNTTPPPSPRGCIEINAISETNTAVCTSRLSDSAASVYRTRASSDEIADRLIACINRRCVVASPCAAYFGVVLGREIRVVHKDGKCLRLRHSHDVTTIAFSNDGKTVVGGDAGGQMSLWDCATGELLNSLEIGVADFIAFCPVGRLVAVAGAMGWRLFDLEHSSAVFRNTERCRHVVWLRFSADGQHLMTADGNLIRWWDRATGKLIAELLVPTRQIRSVDTNDANDVLLCVGVGGGQVLFYGLQPAVLNWISGECLTRAQDQCNAILDGYRVRDCGHEVYSPKSETTLPYFKVFQLGGSVESQEIPETREILEMLRNDPSFCEVDQINLLELSAKKKPAIERVSFLEDALRISKSANDSKHLRSARIHSNLAVAYGESGDFLKADRHWKESLKISARVASNGPQLMMTASQYGHFCLEQSRPQDAEKWLSRALSWLDETVQSRSQSFLSHVRLRTNTDLMMALFFLKRLPAGERAGWRALKACEDGIASMIPREFVEAPFVQLRDFFYAFEEHKKIEKLVDKGLELILAGVQLKAVWRKTVLELLNSLMDRDQESAIAFLQHLQHTANSQPLDAINSTASWLESLQYRIVNSEDLSHASPIVQMAPGFEDVFDIGHSQTDEKTSLLTDLMVTPDAQQESDIVAITKTEVAAPEAPGSESLHYTYDVESPGPMPDSTARDPVRRSKNKPPSKPKRGTRRKQKRRKKRK